MSDNNYYSTRLDQPDDVLTTGRSCGSKGAAVDEEGAFRMEFNQVSTGNPGLDSVLNSLRLGDNVVWQVDKVEEYKVFAQAFVKAALAAGRRVVYIRFGQHPAVIPPQPEIKIYRFEAGRGFESFSAAIREIITEEGEEVFYVFDSLSDLLSEWSTDLMIGNFFLITCPYLFQLKTVAYFAVLRDRHAYQTIARIRDTTQVLIDVFHKDRFYIHPIKVWRRYAPTMFLPHVFMGDDLVPLTSSADVAELFAAFPNRGVTKSERKLDYWDHLFLRAADLAKKSVADNPAVQMKQKELLEKLLKIVISRNDNILDLAHRYLNLQDMVQIKTRLIGSGFIGGKAVGLLLARAILRANLSQMSGSILEPHDSFYIGSDVYYTYLVENGCWQLRQEQKKEESYFSAAAVLKEKLAGGAFPEAIREHFLEMLEYFGQAPIIVRSSSLLEDGFGNAFAGKYESVFCVNQGTLSERYDQFVRAIRKVYASTMNEDALVYRKQRGLADSDEQMALLVQRVSGSVHGDYFYPDLAGVGLSYNSYVWNERMDPQAGMLRLVYGLGTRAVDRVDDDYARIVPLDQPMLNPVSNSDEERSYTQHGVDLLDINNNAMKYLSFQELVNQNAVSEITVFAARDTGGDSGGFSPNWHLNFAGLLRETPFPKIMRDMLHTLEAAYCYPVDTEFTVNFRSVGQFTINMLQCRPLQIKRSQARVEVPEDISEERIILETYGRFLGGSQEHQITRIVYIDPPRYAELPMSEKYQVARIIGQINRMIEDREKTPTMLLGPGRWGTSTPSLGIPVSFAEINKFLALGEIAFITAGFVPELSYGTHFFHDIVETEIFYMVINDADAKTKFRAEFFAEQPNRLGDLIPNSERWRDVIRVVIPDESRSQIWLHADIVQQRALCWLRNNTENRSGGFHPIDL